MDKIASVTLNCPLKPTIWVNDDYPCKEGDLVAVRILNTKSTYNTLELVSGRMSALRLGDVVVGALGHRKAVQGYAGVVPTELTTGDTINLLNLGGVLGTCTSASPLVGKPFECEVLGQVLSFPFLGSRVGVPATIVHEEQWDELPLGESKTPIIAMVGTGMNSGKTEACVGLVQHLTHRGLRVACAKTTGVSLRRDILAMQDAGAETVSIFTDLGIVTTTPESAPGVTRELIRTLVRTDPDVIVLELGDGLLGEYGVSEILSQTDIRANLSAVLLAATDPVSAWGGAKLLRDEYGIEPTLMTGPATDNEAGIRLVKNKAGVHGINARLNGAEMVEYVWSRVEVCHAKT